MRPDLPRPLAALFVAGAPVNPATQNISLIEVMSAMAAQKFPAELPPVFFTVILVGGQPGTIYATKLRVKDSSGRLIAEAAGPDVPITTQIKRVNIAWPLQAISKAPDAIQGPGTYVMELEIRDTIIARAELEIQRATMIPTSSPPPS